jgi:HSP20 family protein
MMPFEPASDLLSLRDAMNRLMEESFIRPTTMITRFAGVAATFPVDLYETDNELVLRAALPGVKPENVDITAMGDELTIKAEIKPPAEDKDVRWHRQERRHGLYVRTIELPITVDTDKIDATFENGVLNVVLPKSAEMRPKTIKVKTAGR